MTGRLLVARVGAELVAFPVDAIRELLDAPAVLPVPLAPPALLGHVVLRGQHLPLLSAGELLGIPTARATRGAWVALVVQDASFALATDDAVDLWEDGEAALRPVPSGSDARGLLRAVLQRGNAVAGLVDPAALRARVVATLQADSRV